MPDLHLVVRHIHAETALIRRLQLAAADGTALPPASSGAHLQLTVPGLHERRCYSLVHSTVAEAADPAPTHYHLAVRREEPSSGGSLWMHGLQVGDSLFASAPKTDFPLHPAQAAEPPVLLLAGGIGITPIISHAAALQAAGRAFVLHYSGRSRDQLALLPELQALCGAALHLHADDEPATRLDLSALLDTCQPGQHLYVCGPKGLIDAVIATWAACGRPREQLHFELFSQAGAHAGDGSFELELRQTGKVLHVPADKTILEVLEAAGLDPMYDCRRGECGVCQCTVLEGVPEHRDYFLSDSEKAAGKLIQTCISRAQTPRLVLDL